MQQRGIPLDAAKREQFRAETIIRLQEAVTRIGTLTQDYHARRLVQVQEGIDSVTKRLHLEVSADTLLRCPEHPTYIGLTKRLKAACCKAVYEQTTNLRARVHDFKLRISRGKAILKRLGPTFQATNDHHWRWLLFDKTGLGLKPAHYTDKAKLPAVDDEAIEKLQFRHPEIELLTLRVDSKQAEARLTRRLGMVQDEDGVFSPNPAAEPDERGRVHFAYAMHRSTGRISSGADYEEEDKGRDSPGNAQNIPEKDLEMFVAEPGFVLLSLDYSQIEARTTAWHADEREMLALWQEAEKHPGDPAYDIHCINALAMWKALVACGLWKGVEPSLEGTRDPAVTMLFEGKQVTFRYANKRRTHGKNYGMGPRKASRMYGTPLAAEEAMDLAYWAKWRRIAAWQKEEFALANSQRWLANSWGAKLWFHEWRWDRVLAQWVVDREKALAFRPQTDVAMMIISLKPAAEQLGEKHRGELLKTDHDSLTWMIPDDERTRLTFAAESATLMEREWPQLGEKPGFGRFRCPTDLALGYNRGEWSESNPRGMRKMKP